MSKRFSTCWHLFHSIQFYPPWIQDAWSFWSAVNVPLQLQCYAWGNKAIKRWPSKWYWIKEMASSIPRPYDINKTTRHQRISSLDKIPDCLSNWNELNLSLLVFIIGTYWSNIQLVGAVNPWKQYLKTCLSKNAKPRNPSPPAESGNSTPYLFKSLKATPQVSMKLGSRLRPLDVILTCDLETWKPGFDSEEPCAKYIPPKTNLDTQNSHIWKEVHLKNHHFGIYVGFRGSICQ